MKQLFLKIILTSNIILFLNLSLTGCSEEFFNDPLSEITGLSHSGTADGTIDLAHGGSGGTGVIGGGSGGTGVIMGTITQIAEENTIIVSGINIDTSEASVEIEDNPATPGDLEVGMYVNIEATFSDTPDHAIAHSIVVDTQFEGLIEDIDFESNQILMFGQTIVVDELTVFKQGSLESLKAGYRIAVNGYHDAGGVLHALFVELLSDEIVHTGTEQFTTLTVQVWHVDYHKQIIILDQGDFAAGFSTAEIHFDFPMYPGLVINLVVPTDEILLLDPISNRITRDLDDPLTALVIYQYGGPDGAFATTISGIINRQDQTNNSFYLNGWRVMPYSGTKYVGLDNHSGLTEGLYIKVKAHMYDGWLLAGSIENLSANTNLDNGDMIQMVGVVTQLENHDFKLSNLHLPVIMTGETEFINGQHHNIGINIKLEVNGIVNNNQQIEATQIRFVDSSSSMIESTVTDINLDQWLINIAGVDVVINPYTMMRDNLKIAKTSFGLADIQKGDHLLIHGHHDSDGFIATRIDRLEQ